MMIMKIKNDVICACALWGDVVPIDLPYF